MSYNVFFISLGCAKNQVNCEQMMALCLQAGHTVQEDCSGSDVVVINTCGFIDSAKSEAIDTILSAAQLKDAGEIQKILVTGCLSQRYQADILDELPENDGIMGTGCFGDIVPALEQVITEVVEADAEDIAQEVFISYVKARPGFESAEHEKAWLLRVTINRCKSFFRSAWQRKTTGLEADFPDTPFTSAISWKCTCGPFAPKVASVAVTVPTI